MRWVECGPSKRVYSTTLKSVRCSRNRRLVNLDAQIHEAQRQVPEIDQAPIFRAEERRLGHVRIDVGIERGQHLGQQVLIQAEFKRLQHRSFQSGCRCFSKHRCGSTKCLCKLDIVP